MKSVYKVSTTKNVRFTQSELKSLKSRDRSTSKNDSVSESLSDSFNERPHEPVDSKCPKCKIMLILPKPVTVVTEKPPEKVLIDQFERIIRGRQSTIYSSMLNNVQKRVESFKAKEDDDELRRGKTDEHYF